MFDQEKIENPKVVHVSTWDEFKSTIIRYFLEKSKKNPTRFIYRGHSNEQFALLSSFDRQFPAYNEKDIAEQLLEHYETKCRESNLVEKSIIDDKSKFMAFAQHHGLPTRLLDWSESPYVSSFFAFSGANSIRDLANNVAVFVLDTQSKAFGKNTGLEIISVGRDFNKRLANQQGKFTILSSMNNTIEEHFKDFDKEQVLWKFLIPVSEASYALNDLSLMGINYSNIYPDLEGLARDTKSVVFYKIKNG